MLNQIFPLGRDNPMKKLICLICALYSASINSQEANEFASNETRTMCIEGWAHYMEVAGWESHIEEGNLDTLMISAHTMRQGNLNCFISIDGKLFHLLLNFEEEEPRGLLVRYEVSEFTSL